MPVIMIKLSCYDIIIDPTDTVSAGSLTLQKSFADPAGSFSKSDRFGQIQQDPDVKQFPMDTSSDVLKWRQSSGTQSLGTQSSGT
jgi:hypothetical protein